MVKGLEHLTDAQLEHYGTENFTVTSEVAQSIEAHLEECADCRSRVLENQRVRFGLQTDALVEPAAKPGPSAVQDGSDESTSRGRGPSEPDSIDIGSMDIGSTDIGSSDSGSGDHRGVDRDPYIHPSLACTLSDGPSEDDLRNLAAGIVTQDKDRAALMTQHVAECPHCAFILRAFTEDFSDDPTSEDTASLSELESSSSGWQKRLIQKLFPPK